MKFCNADIEAAVLWLQSHKLWSTELQREIVSIINDFFNLNYFRLLPDSMMHEILLWLPVDTLLPVFTVSWDWCETVTSNEVWTRFYHQKFLMNNPGRLPVQRASLITEFRHRLADPHVGDKVEVAWRGKFRLETQDVYQGLAWWVAEIVEKNSDQARYKIRYPGWESRWDEWVPRSRLRWTVQRNVLVGIGVGDIVELWCCGANVPGAWLEAKVKRVKSGRFCIGRVLSSGYLWVERDRLRLVRRASQSIASSGSLPGQGKSVAAKILSCLMGKPFASNNDDGIKCSIM